MSFGFPADKLTRIVGVQWGEEQTLASSEIFFLSEPPPISTRRTVARYDADTGALLWAKNEQANGTGVCIGPENTVAVGWQVLSVEEPPEPVPLQIRKFDEDGVLLWTHELLPAGHVNTGVGTFTNCLMDGDGNVIFLTTGSGTYDVLGKIDGDDGSTVWKMGRDGATTVGSPPSPETFTPTTGFAVDPDGNIYTSQLEIPGASALYKFSPAGTLVNSITAGNSSGVWCDDAGNVFLQSQISLVTSTTIRKYSPAGTLLKTLTLPNESSILDVDEDGAVWVAYGGTSVRKYDNDLVYTNFSINDIGAGTAAISFVLVGDETMKRYDNSGNVEWSVDSSRVQQIARRWIGSA